MRYRAVGAPDLAALSYCRHHLAAADCSTELYGRKDRPALRIQHDQCPAQIAEARKGLEIGRRCLGHRPGSRNPSLGKLSATRWHVRVPFEFHGCELGPV